MPFSKALFLQRKFRFFVEIENSGALSIAGGGGKRDCGTQMLELAGLGYANNDDVAKAVREELARITRAS